MLLSIGKLIKKNLEAMDILVNALTEYIGRELKADSLKKGGESSGNKGFCTD